MKALSYFPGCSLESTAKEYDISTREVCKTLGIDLQDIDDWNCCGATSVTSVNKTTATALPARNLAIAEKKNQDIVTPCNACFNKLKKAAKKLRDDETLRKNVNEVLLDEEGVEYTGKNKIRHILDVLVNDAGAEISNRVVNPLTGLKVVPYYGCLISKAPQFTDFENPDRPIIMDRLLEKLGAEVIEFDLKTRCCGGPVVMTKEEVTYKLTGDILMRAKELDADCVVVPCPMCHFSLDSKQKEVENYIGKSLRLPILYFTQLIGLALGIEAKKLGLERNIVNTKDLVKVIT